MSPIMRKTFLALGIIIAVNLAPTDSQTITHAQLEIPAYAKWGKLAIKETHTKYPDAKIIDYLYEGNEFKEATTIEKFKFWLKDGDNEFGVFVRIEYTTETEEVVTIEFRETSR